MGTCGDGSGGVLWKILHDIIFGFVRKPWAVATMAYMPAHMPFVGAEGCWRDGVSDEGREDEGHEDVMVRVFGV